jgi:hypothetical protein
MTEVLAKVGSQLGGARALGFDRRAFDKARHERDPQPARIRCDLLQKGLPYWRSRIGVARLRAVDGIEQGGTIPNRPAHDV